MQEVFSRAYNLFVFRYHRLQDFLLESFSFQEFFFGGIVTPPSVISSGLHRSL